MLSVVIIGLLIALLAPQLAPVRARANEVRSLSNLRNHAAVFAGYSAENRDRFPYYVDRDATYTVLRRGRHAVRVYYFLTSHLLWNYVLTDAYGDDPFHPSFTPPGTIEDGERRTRMSFTRYYYAHTFLAKPAYWNPETRLADKSQLGPTNQSDVRYPSQKGLLLDYTSYTQNERTFEELSTNADVLVGFVDGSARAIGRREFGPTYPGGAGYYHWMSWPVMHTIDGVDDRDVR